MTRRLTLLLACLALAAIAVAQKPASLQPAALNEMVETERAFAAMGAEKGVRDSFWEFFGEEGISFNPHPGKFREFVRKNPLPNPPPAREFRLEWWPVYGDVAESGDVGYNTGPTLVTDITTKNRPSRHGYFFSVWKRQPDGAWRVAVDMGSDTPGPDPAHQDRLRYTRAPQQVYQKVKYRGADAGRADIMNQEGRFLKVVTQRGTVEGYLSHLAEGGRIHRPGIFPAIGKSAVRVLLEAQNSSITQWQASDGGVAATGELGYTYGSYELKRAAATGDAIEKGYYTRVWKRDAQGQWKIVADVLSPLPAQP